jgi:citrate lyase subunit beta / citryl-CoA lyase
MSWRPGPAWLFCPADRPDRYLKALTLADAVVLDIEDAVAPGNKAAARSNIALLIREGVFEPDRTIVRIHGSQTEEHQADLDLLQATGIGRVMLAKAERLFDVQRLDTVEVVLLLETALGIERAGDLAGARNVVGLMWGADDLVASLGGSSSRDAAGGYREFARYARSRSHIAAKAHGRLSIDAVFMDIADQEGLRAECEDALAVGFDATVAIHPTQIPVIREAYRPSPAQIEWAQRLLAAAGTDRGVTTFEGRMVDGPIYAQAEQILARAMS